MTSVKNGFEGTQFKFGIKMILEDTTITQETCPGTSE